MRHATRVRGAESRGVVRRPSRNRWQSHLLVPVRARMMGGMARKRSYDDASEQLTLDLFWAEETTTKPAIVAEPATTPSERDSAREGLRSRSALGGALGFSPLDRQFADFLEARASATLPGPARETLWLGGALTSLARANGRGYLDLRHPPAGWPEKEPWPALAEWEMALANSGVVTSDPQGDAEDAAWPLTLAHGGAALYLTRYWRAEQYIAQELRRRASQVAPLTDASPAEIAQALDAVFKNHAPDAGLDWQRAAIYLMLRRGFLVVSGGPGTGKTRVAGALLEVLGKLIPSGAGELRCALAAPTGKAAARLQEGLGALTPEPGLRIAPASTLHRLLGGHRDGRPFRHGPGYPLAEHLVILDECSMVDLLLMEQLLRALPPSTGLLLLGDKDQLAPVEVGGFLAELGKTQPEGALDADSRADLAEGFGAAAVASVPVATQPTMLLQLQRNFRFGEGNGIHALSQAIRAGRIEDALRLLELAETDPAQTPGLKATRYTADALPTAGLTRLARDWFGEWRSAPTPEAGLAALKTRRLLAPTRKGPLGVIALNKHVETSLNVAESGPAGQNYPGRPVLILTNDYALRLFNGETGILLPDPADAEGRVRAWFPKEERTRKGVISEIRAIAPVRLPLHETAYAMTVHKSQGSEFEEVALILPAAESEVLCRELIYTAVTRARTSVEVWYEPRTLRWALARQAPRSSRLADLTTRYPWNCAHSHSPWAGQ